MDPILIASAIFMIAVLFVGSVYFFIWELPEREKRKKVRDRLESISEAGRRMPSPELDIIKNELLSDVPAFNKLLLQFAQPRPRVRQLRSDREVITG